jgi:cellobiose-specific phosphotransferase system component IIA
MFAGAIAVVSLSVKAETKSTVNDLITQAQSQHKLERKALTDANAAELKALQETQKEERQNLTLAHQEQRKTLKQDQKANRQALSDKHKGIIAALEARRKNATITPRTKK